MTTDASRPAFGARVRITGGPFAGNEGTLERAPWRDYGGALVRLDDRTSLLGVAWHRLVPTTPSERHRAMIDEATRRATELLEPASPTSQAA